ncbi:MAG: hypothetical protein ACR2J4_08750 [Deinococcus sp.]
MSTPTLQGTLAALAPLIPERLEDFGKGWFIYLDGRGIASVFAASITKDHAEPSAFRLTSLAILQATLQQACETRGWGWEIDYSPRRAAGRYYGWVDLSPATGGRAYPAFADSAAHALALALLAALEAR